MGEYTTRVRYGGAFRSRVNNPLYSSFRTAEYVYSWRTQRSAGDLSDKDAGTSAGIKQPIQRGDLGGIIRDRKRYSEDIMQTLGGMGGNPAPSTSTTVNCLTDTGHKFTSLKYNSVQQGLWTEKVRSTGAIRRTSLFADPGVFRPPQIPAIPNFPTLAGTSYAPTASTRNARLNAVFDEMRPNAEIAQIGETVVSLLRGDFPTVLKNIRKTLLRARSAGDASKYAGEEYLNVVFGWQPLIRDFENAIRVLTVVDRLIFGIGYRRHRVVPWDSVFSTGYLSNYTSIYPSIGGSVISGNGLRDYTYLDRVSTYDIRLSARLVPLARPGIGANAFIDQAEEKLSQLGLWYPALGWDLLPYSWLIDWFTNLGSSLTNAMSYGNSPGLVNIDYCWATSCLRVVSNGGSNVHGWFPVGAYDYKIEGAPRSYSVAKTRHSATPFGFGLDLSALNAGQVSILVALGLAKRP